MPRIKKVTGNSNLDKALSEMPDMKNTEALNVGLALQEIMRQNQSILQNMDTMGDQLGVLKAKMDKYDRDAEKFNADKIKYLTEVEEKANKLRVKGAAKDKLIAQGTLMAQKAIEKARANNSVDKLAFERDLARMPKVTVTSTGRMESGITAGGQQVTQLVPEEIRIKHKVWRLPIGQAVEVPQIVAERMLDIRRGQQETSEIQGVLTSGLEHHKQIEEMNKINHKPGYSKSGIIGLEDA